MTTANMEIVGLDKLAQALLRFSDTLAKRTLNYAVSEGAKVIQDEAIERAPEYSGRLSADQPPPGSLKKAIQRAYLHSESSVGYSVYHVFVRAGKARQHVKTRKRVKGVTQTVNLDVYYAYYVEYGSIHNHTPAAYMRGAFLAKGQAAVYRIRDVLASELSGAAAEAKG